MTTPLGNLLPEPSSATLSRRSNGLMLHFALQGRYLFLQVRNDGLPPRHVMAAEPAAMHHPALAGGETSLEIVTLDVAATSPTLMLDFRNIELAVNHPWKTCTTGLLAMMGEKAATVEALSKGIPCVVCVRPGKANVQWLRGFAPSLNFDSIRR
mmetsp:Transcript_18421/g.35519  ORF Transcript_18421/g.35519 Transcript_18421/m.35519 type:complete len:154 (-) Transcript_18421:193-654(-)